MDEVRACRALADRLSLPWADASVRRSSDPTLESRPEQSEQRLARDACSSRRAGALVVGLHDGQLQRGAYEPKQLVLLPSGHFDAYVDAFDPGERRRP
jgi:hypothetical protein